MQIDTHSSIAAFLAAAGPWLMADESGNNVILANAHLLLDGDHPFREPYLFATVRDGRRVVGTALRAPPDSLNLSALPAAAVAPLAEAIAARHPNIPSVAGPAAVAHEFAHCWCRANRGEARLRHAWYLYVLERLCPVARRVTGSLRHANEGDLPQLRAWGPRYADAFNTRVDVTAYLERMVRRRCLYLWDDGGAKCLVSLSGWTPNGVRLSAVYTPDEYRNHGYATAAVAAVSEIALDGDKSLCMLFAETADPTANAIYRRIGYVPVAEHAMIDLDVPLRGDGAAGT